MTTDERTPGYDPDSNDGGRAVGMAHPTVVPTNFDPPARSTPE